jgi:hypothetical protein
MLENLLREHVVLVTFTKVDGSERKMSCTLIDNLIKIKPEGRDLTRNENIVRVWDTEKEAWRSFRRDSVISVEIKS